MRLGITEMSRRFIVGIEESTPEQRDSLRKFFKEHGSWWSWIPNFWLVTTDEEAATSYLRDRIMAIVPGANVIVIDQDQPHWSGYGTKTEKSDMFRWLRGTWKGAERLP